MSVKIHEAVHSNQRYIIFEPVEKLFGVDLTRVCNNAVNRGFNSFGR
jgi:hypothetical protein